MKKKTKKRKHRHTWDTDGEFCGHCGWWPEYCKKCGVVRWVSPDGKKKENHF